MQGSNTDGSNRNYTEKSVKGIDTVPQPMATIPVEPVAQKMSLDPFTCMNTLP